MALIEWDDDFLLGVEEIDEHTKQFVTLLNLIQKECARADSGSCTASLLSALTSLSSFHFEHEERLMHRIRFPEFLAHKQEHDAFLSRVASISTLSLENQGSFVEFLGTWTHRHFHQFHAELKAMLRRS